MGYVTPGQPKKKIVITGVGMVTPVGIGADKAYKAMCEGKSGIQKLPGWADEYPAQLAGVVDFDAKANGLKGKTINRNGAYTFHHTHTQRKRERDTQRQTKQTDTHTHTHAEI